MSSGPFQRRAAAWLLAALATSPIAGCVSAPVESGPAPVEAPPDPTRRFHLPLRIGPAMSEGFVAASPDGREILACTHGGFRAWSPLYASTDGGSTFAPQAPAPTPGGDCEVDRGPDGTWYAIASTVASASVAVSRDQGRTWRVNHVSALPDNGMADRPWLLATKDFLLLTTVPTRAQPGVVGATRSLDGGASWEPTRPITTLDPVRDAVRSREAWADAAGTVYVPWVKYSLTAAILGGPLSAQFGLSISADRGGTWREVAVGGPRPWNPFHFAAAAAADGTIYVAFQAGAEPGNPLVYLASKDRGQTWSNASLLSDRVRAMADGTSPFMRGGTSGSWVDVAWEGPEQLRGPLALFVARLGGAESAAPTAIRLANATGAEYVALTHLEDGRAVIVQPMASSLWLHREA